MINFRYHVVSLMAVFLALAVGIVLGVTLLSGPANETIQAQAAADRRELQQTRAELTRVNALDAYRDGWAEKVGTTTIAGALQGNNVAIVAMPNAPSRVIGTIRQAVETAGGRVVSSATVSPDVFDPDRQDAVSKEVDSLADRAGAAADATVATKYGLVLARGLLAASSGTDGEAQSAVQGLTSARLLSMDGQVWARASLVVVVSAPAPAPTDPTVPNDVLTAHTQTEIALRQVADGEVVAGPNSDNVASTDVQVLRSAGPATDKVSTVDVADLPSGVVTTILALQEQRQGGQGHYGAFGDAVAPDLPIR